MLKLCTKAGFSCPSQRLHSAKITTSGFDSFRCKKLHRLKSLHLSHQYLLLYLHFTHHWGFYKLICIGVCRVHYVAHVCTLCHSLFPSCTWSQLTQLRRASKCKRVLMGKEKKRKKQRCTIPSIRYSQV